MLTIVKNINKTKREASSKPDEASQIFYKEIILCIRRACTLRYAEAKAFLSKNHLLTDIYIIQTKERSVSYDDTNYKRKGVSSNWHPYYIVHFFICQRFFWKFFKFFYRKRQPISIGLSFSVFNTFQYTPVWGARRRQTINNIAYTHKLHNS